MKGMSRLVAIILLLAAIALAIPSPKGKKHDHNGKGSHKAHGKGGHKPHGKGGHNHDHDHHHDHHDHDHDHHHHHDHHDHDHHGHNHEHDHAHVGNTIYWQTPVGTLCGNGKYEITSQKECKLAGEALGLQWSHSWNVPNDFPACLYADDESKKVYFNRSPNPGRTNVNQKYSAICWTKDRNIENGITKIKADNSEADITNCVPYKPSCCPTCRHAYCGRPVCSEKAQNVDCEWSSWSASSCSKACAPGGTRTLTRSKTKIENYGGTCTGLNQKTENCNQHKHCPVDCKWGSWTASSCSKPCAPGGTRTLTRSKTKIENYGGTCTGLKHKTENCNQHKPCPDAKKCNGVPTTDWKCCTSTDKCSFGEGDCDRDSHCSANLVCGRDNCKRDFTINGSNWKKAADCCVKKH